MLYISDLDGTLLNSNCELSKFTRTQLTELLNNGLKFTIATARGIYSIKEILGDLPLQLPVICNNGAYIRDFTTQEALYQSAFQQNVVNHILNFIEKNEMEAFVTSFNPKGNNGRGEDCLTHNLTLNEGMRWFLHDRIRSNDPRMKSNVHFSNSLDNQITCLTIIDELTPVTNLKNQIDRAYSHAVQTNIMINPYQRGFYWLTVQDIDTTKGNAVKWLTNYLNQPINNVTVFGDEVNDISMFEMAGKKIAIDDAVQPLLNMADIVIGNNNDNAVVNFIIDNKSNND